MRTDDRTLAGFLFFLGSLQFFLAMLVAEGMRPNYSISTNAISDLGVDSTAVLFNASVALLGILGLAGTYFYHRTHQKLWITIPFALAGIGPIGVGVFPETTGVPHVLFAFVSFVFGGLVAILISVRTPPPIRYVSAVLGVVGLVALVLFVAGQYAGIGFGGMERMIAYLVLLWEIAFGGFLMSKTEEQEPAAVPDSPG